MDTNLPPHAFRVQSLKSRPFRDTDKSLFYRKTNNFSHFSENTKNYFFNSTCIDLPSRAVRMKVKNSCLIVDPGKTVIHQPDLPA